MTSAHVTAGLSALIFTFFLLLLLRRDHIYIRQALFWVAVTSAILLFGLAPSLIDMIGHQLGISYPPIVLAVVAILILLVKSLEADLAMTRMERRIRRLSQRLAIFEGEADDKEYQTPAPGNRPNSDD